VSGWELFDWLEPRFVLWIAAGLMVVTAVVFNLGPAAELKSRTTKLPESSGGFSEEELRKHLRDINRSMRVYNRDAHNLYHSHLKWDSVYAIVYGIALSLVIVGVWRQGIEVGWLDALEAPAILSPLLFAGWDLAENVQLSRAIAAIPSDALKSPSGAKPPTWTTRSKWIFGLLTLMFLVAGLIGLVADKALV
jgi:hypothetical protein